MARRKVSWKTAGWEEGRKGGRHYGATKGLSSPKNSRRGCLCKDTNTYSTKCCEGYLINQGIGQTEREGLERGAFSAAFSTAFDVKEIYDY